MSASALLILSAVVTYTYHKFQTPKFNKSTHEKSAYPSQLSSDVIRFELKTENPKRNMDCLEFKLTNLSTERLFYGSEFELDVNIDGEWYVIPPMTPEGRLCGWTASAYLSKAGSTFVQEVHTVLYDLRYDAKYRIVKEIGEYVVAAEFELQ